MPGLRGGVIPLDCINMSIECEVVQSHCSVVVCQRRVAYHVPSRMELDGLVGGWLGAIIQENGVSWLGDVDPEGHGFI